MESCERKCRKNVFIARQKKLKDDVGNNTRGASSFSFPCLLALPVMNIDERFSTVLFFATKFWKL